MSAKEDRTKAGGSFDGHTTLRRTVAKQNSNSSSSDTSTLKGPMQNRRQNVDSGYSTCDGLERRWSQDLTTSNDATKWSPTPIRLTPKDHGQYIADLSPTSPAPSTPTQHQNNSCNDDISPTGAENRCDSEPTQNFASGSHTNRYSCYS